MNFVLDASVALSWCFADESSDTTIGLLKQLDKDMAFVPSIWPLEFGNVLLMAASIEGTFWCGIRSSPKPNFIASA